jgi:hypothetical protein
MVTWFKLTCNNKLSDLVSYLLIQRGCGVLV